MLFPSFLSRKWRCGPVDFPVFPEIEDKKSKRLVVATHGFVKKTWKVSAKEIAKAEALRKEYYESEQ